MCYKHVVVKSECAGQTTFECFQTEIRHRICVLMRESRKLSFSAVHLILFAVFPFSFPDLKASVWIKAIEKSQKVRIFVAASVVWLAGRSIDRA